MSATSSVGGEVPTYTAEDLLSLDNGQLVEFVKRCSRPEGGFDISSASGLDAMSEPRRKVLFEKLRAAMRQLENSNEVAPLDVGTLLERLANIADGPNDSREHARPECYYEELESTMPPSTSEGEDLELMCREELLQNGGRLVALDIASLTERERKKLPWLDDPWSRDGVPRVFSRQADRWWEFIKWQMDNRGPEAGDYGFSAYLAAQKRRRLRSHHMVSSSAFEDTIGRMWEMRTKLLEVPSDAGFPAYQEAVKERLALHNFTQEFRLEANPRQQDAWTTWVEYLNFEYWEADRLAASLRTSERRYCDAWDNFQRVDASQPSWPVGVAMSFSEAGPADAPDLEQQLAETQAKLEALQERVDSFIRETALHRRKEESIRRQRILTRWVLEQMHLIEAETAQQRTIRARKPRPKRGDAVSRDRNKTVPQAKTQLDNQLQERQRTPSKRRHPKGGRDNLVDLAKHLTDRQIRTQPLIKASPRAGDRALVA